VIGLALSGRIATSIPVGRPGFRIGFGASTKLGANAR
jgi:hypothetical protein